MNSEFVVTEFSFNFHVSTGDIWLVPVKATQPLDPLPVETSESLWNVGDLHALFALQRLISSLARDSIPYFNCVTSMISTWTIELWRNDTPLLGGVRCNLHQPSINKVGSSTANALRPLTCQAHDVDAGEGQILRLRIRIPVILLLYQSKSTATSLHFEQESKQAHSSSNFTHSY
jgi:hypothetical protein